MAGYSAVARVAVGKMIETTNTPVIEHEAKKNELSKDAEKLFQELMANMNNDNKKNSFSEILLKLNDICHHLITGPSYPISIAFDVFNAILRNYMKLLDSDQFIDAIEHKNAIENNNFLRKFFQLTRTYQFNAFIEQQAMKTQREMLFSLFDQLNSSHRIVSYLQNIISNETDTNKILVNCYNTILCAFFQIVKEFQVKLTDNDLEKYQNTLLLSFIQFINKYFTDKAHLRVNEKLHKILVLQILQFIVGTTNQTLTIPIFVNINLPQMCLQWLSVSYLTNYELIIIILNNLARHDKAAMALHKSECGKIVREFKTNQWNTNVDLIINKSKRLKIARYLDLTLSLILDPDEVHPDEINNAIISQILYLNNSVPALGLSFCEDCHISELLLALMKLFTSDNVMNYIIEKSPSRVFFFTTLKSYLSDVENEKIDFEYFHLDVLAIMAIANIFWSMSFQDRYKTDLIQNTSLLKRFEAFRENDVMDSVSSYISVTHHMSSLRRAMEGIWQNLYPSMPSKVETTSINSKKVVYSVMISYSHLDIDFGRQLYDVLNRIPQLSISVDFKTGKYFWKEVTQTIEQADVVLFLLSKSFFHDKSCRQEFIYATDTVKKLFFPIFINEDFKPIGWLHNRIARLKSIRFGRTDFMNSCEELLSMINENLHVNISLVRNALDLKQWNDEQVQQWFMKNHILPELYEFYQFRDGHELLLYAQAILRFPWIDEYERIKLRFEEKFQQEKRCLSCDEFLQLFNALERFQRQNFFG